MSRFGAEKSASISAPFERPCFESSEHGSTHTTKPRVRRYIVESDLTRVSDRPHCKGTVVIDCHEHRIARLDNPRPMISGVLLASHRLKISGSFR
jgi:hypothetical protein